MSEEIENSKKTTVLSKTLIWLKNPYNIAFLILIFITLSIYVPDLFIDSIWLDETAYMWEAQLTEQNPSYLFNIEGFSSHFPVLMIILFDTFTTNFNAARLMGLFFSILGIIFAYLLGSEIKNKASGLILAALVGFHVWYRFLGLKGLVDTPVTAMFIAYSYFLYMSVKYRKKTYIALSIIVGILTMYTKFSGIFVIVVTPVYLLLLLITKKDFKLKEFVSKNKKKIIGACVLLIISYFAVPQIKFLILSVGNGIHLDQLGNSITMLNSLTNKFWAILFFIGLFITIVYRTKEYLLLTVIPTIYLTVGSVIAQGQALYEIRYFMPNMPFIYLLGILTIYELFQITKMFVPKLKDRDQIFNMTIILLIFILAVTPTINVGKTLINQRSFSYSGYLEAMDWIHDNVPDNGEERIANFFACCDYNVGMTNDGDVRRTNNTPKYFQQFDSFKERIESSPQETIYLMADAWEPGQPEWIRPMDQQKFETILSLGFQVVYVVERPVPTNQGLQKGPAIIIFKKN